MTISIKGTAPKFDQAELDQRQSLHCNMYKNTLQCKEVVRAEIPYNFLLAVIKKSADGYVLDDKLPIKMEPLNYSAYMVKPEHLQQADLVAIDEKVKRDYIEFLESERQRYRELLTQQLLNKAELAEQKKIEDKKAKLLAEVEKEVNDVFGALVVPD